MKAHITFFWCNRHATEIIFSGWPGQSFKSYMLALALVFVLSFTVEWLSHTKLIKSRTDNVTAGFLQTVMYATRVVMAYLVMLSVMSFDIGVLLTAVAGYSIGFLIFGSQLFKNSKIADDHDLPPLNC